LNAWSVFQRPETVLFSRKARPFWWIAGTAVIVYSLGVLASMVFFTARDVRRDGWASWLTGGGLRTSLHAVSWPVQATRVLLGGREGGDDMDFIAGEEPLPRLPSLLALKPVRYPRLLDCLREKKEFELHYRSVSGTVDIIHVRRKRKKGVIIERDAYIRVRSSSGAGGANNPAITTLVQAHVTLTDHNGDASLDSVEIKAKDWRDSRVYSREIDRPKNDQFTSLWQETLEILYKQSDCFS